MSLEHYLGLTNNPVDGLVQTKCSKRNAHAGNQSLSWRPFALLSDMDYKISFDGVVAAMKETHRALLSLYCETSAGGLAALTTNSRSSSLRVSGASSCIGQKVFRGVAKLSYRQHCFYRFLMYFDLKIEEL